MSVHGLRVRRIRYGDEDFRRAKRWEYEVFGIANGFTTPKDDAAGEMTAYREWERTSEFHVAFMPGHDFGEQQPVAIARFLRHDPRLGIDSFSTLRDFRAHRTSGGPPENYLFPEWAAYFRDADPRRVAELATQAVLPGHRGAGVVEQVWRSFIAVSASEGVQIWTMALVLPLFRWYRALLPEALRAIGRMIPDYVGADSIPAMLELDHPSMLAALAEYDARPHGSLVGASAALGAWEPTL